ncbi:hypothetical protein HPB49_021949 [Dermacentor silvarum]|uniref:Uncharacterized protein n=1 Tax=Dermacentor silvarum TaxID=543639 RepID=A0ACB8DRE7_DERSI|nr:hypothetical protein HPB49_021949 [Dermacentor silvarum]
MPRIETALLECKNSISVVHSAALDWTFEEAPGFSRAPPGNMLATPESPPMSSSMVLREAQRIVQNLEELASTPLVDTRQITLVNFTLQSPELDTSGALRRKLFEEEEAPEHGDTSAGSLLNFAEEHLGAISLGTSTPLVLSPSTPAFGASFTVDTAGGAGLEVCAIQATSPCTLPCPTDIPTTECKVAGPGTLVPRLLPGGSADVPSSPDLVTHDEALELCQAGEGAANVAADDAPAANNETYVQGSDCEADSSSHHAGDAKPDSNLDSALGQGRHHRDHGSQLFVAPAVYQRYSTGPQESPIATPRASATSCRAAVDDDQA